MQQGKNSGVRADAQGERKDRHERGTGVARQLAHAEADVLRQAVAPDAGAGFIKPLFGPRLVAEVAARLLASFGVAGALFAQAVSLDLQVRVDFRAEIARRSLFAEHRSN